VLRVWRNEKGFAGFYCARCEASGYAWDGKAISPRGEIASEHDHHAPLHVRKPELVERERAYKLDNARNYWRRRQPIEGTPAERYLRERRGYTGPLPGTLGFLPARSGFPAMLVAAFGMPDEPEPGVLAIAESCVIGVHVTHLTNDGRKLGDAAKRMHGELPAGRSCLHRPTTCTGSLSPRASRTRLVRTRRRA
jgi:hypothetical protein